MRHFTLEYWLDEGWYIGRLKEVPGVFSQGETLSELEENVRDAYRLVQDDAAELQATEIHSTTDHGGRRGASEHIRRW
jgi:predicted RNase H-like HicB family nuclease